MLAKKKLGVYVSHDLAAKLDLLTERLSHLAEVLDSPERFDLGDTTIFKSSKGDYLEAILKQGISATVNIFKEAAGYDPLDDVAFNEVLDALEKEGRKRLPTQSEYAEAMKIILKKASNFSLTAQEMYVALEKYFDLTEAQLAYTVPSSNKRNAHINNAQWARLKLVKQDVLDEKAGKGIWALKVKN